MDITSTLFGLRDEKYAAFQEKLIPNISADTIIGVRTPLLRDLAKRLRKEGGYESFLSELPHKYFDENQLHAFIISLEKDINSALEQTEMFLPYVDNWATCDQLSPKVFAKHKEKLLEHIKAWIASDKTYTVRFGIGMLMQHFLDYDFKPEYIALAASVESEEYYINMMIAWFLATALAKQYDEAIKVIQSQKLSKWVHNKAIQKAVESYRITDEKKTYLKSMRM